MAEKLNTSQLLDQITESAKRTKQVVDAARAIKEAKSQPEAQAATTTQASIVPPNLRGV